MYAYSTKHRHSSATSIYTAKMRKANFHKWFWERADRFISASYYVLSLFVGVKGGGRCGKRNSVKVTHYFDDDNDRAVVSLKHYNAMKVGLIQLDFRCITKHGGLCIMSYLETSAHDEEFEESPLNPFRSRALGDVWMHKIVRFYRNEPVGMIYTRAVNRLTMEIIKAQRM